MKVRRPQYIACPSSQSESSTDECAIVIALHTAIKELEDEIENPNSILNRTGANKKTELGILVKNCNGVL